jgi:group I intron endonuclease
MKPVAVYMLENKVNKKLYIGQTVSPEKRRNQHNSPTSGCTKISAAIQKHGRDNFEFIVLCWCPDKAYASYVEQKLIEAHNTRRVGYNICVGGEGLGSGADNPTHGVPLTEEHKQKVSVALKGKKKSPEHIAKVAMANIGRKATPLAKVNMSLAHIGHKHTAEAKAKIGLKSRGNTYNTGRKLSEEHKRRISKTLTGTVRSAETRAKMSSVRMRNEQIKAVCGEEVLYFVNATECAEHFGTTRKNIFRYVAGTRKRRDGWVFYLKGDNGN